MISSIDTNIVSTLWSASPQAPHAAALLGQAHEQGGLVICGPVYVELLAHPKATPEFVDSFLATTRITVEFDLPEIVWRAAGKAFADYSARRRAQDPSVNGTKRLLADFLIGAHALHRSDRLLTLDPTRYRTAFPGLKILPA